jgi:hypothetical protein
MQEKLKNIYNPPEKISQDLLECLSEIAKMLIGRRPENDNFRLHPDDPKEHEPGWHQFGILTHTKKFSEDHRTEVPKYLQQWGFKDNIDMKLSEQIDGRTKAELLQISIPLHDLGKFVRNFQIRDNKVTVGHKGHEKKSEKLIMENEQIQNLLKNIYGLTDAQIHYIARCAGLHFELGKLRDQAKKTNSGYTIAYAESEQCKEDCHHIAKTFSEFKEEIGIYF